MVVSRAARLVAITREASDQSVAAIRSSLQLLRQRSYPGEAAARSRGSPAAEPGRPTDRG